MVSFLYLEAVPLRDFHSAHRKRSESLDAAQLDSVLDIVLTHRAYGRPAAHLRKGVERSLGVRHEEPEILGYQIVVKLIPDVTVIFILHHTSEHSAYLELHSLPHDKGTKVVLVGKVGTAVVIVLDIILIAAGQ